MCAVPKAEPIPGTTEVQAVVLPENWPLPQVKPCISTWVTNLEVEGVAQIFGDPAVGMEAVPDLQGIMAIRPEAVAVLPISALMEQVQTTGLW
jgi:hypothetical protein